MANYTVSCSDCGAEFTILQKPISGHPLYCPYCLTKNYKIETPKYLANFVAFLSENLGLQKGDKLAIGREEGLLYHILLFVKGKKMPKIICKINFSIPDPTGPKPTAIVEIITKGSELKDTKRLADAFVKKNGATAVLNIKALRAF